MRRPSKIQARDFDDILEAVGSFGFYQKIRIALLFVPISFFFGFTSASPMFEMVVPPHWCHVPGRENTSLTPQQWRNLTIPTQEDDPDKFSSCLMYDGVWKTQEGNLTYVVTNKTKECSHGWEFDQGDFTETVPSALGWVCDHKTKAQHSLSINLAGKAVGTLLFPMLADNYLGRRRMFFVAVATYVIFTLPLQWLTSAPLRFLFRFLQGTGFETNYLMPYVIMLEVIPPGRRDFTVMLTFVSWTLGMCFTSLVAYLSAYWKTISLVSMAPMIASFAYWRMLPESPRWLLSKGRLRECADVLLQIGKANGAATVSREEVEEELYVLSLRMPSNEPITRVFFYPKLRLRSCMLFLFSCSQFIIYGVLMYSFTVMPGNYFLGHLVLTLFEIPSVFIGMLVVHNLGRRFLGYVALIIIAVCCVAATFCVHDNWSLIGVLALGRLAVVCTLYFVFLVPSEILPTPIRSSGAGMTVVSGMMGMTLSPYLLHSGMGDTFHFWVLIGVVLVGMVTLAPIPETMGLLMPQTFLDGEELGKGRPLTAWIHRWNVHRYPGSPTHEDKEEEAKEDLIMNGKK